MRVLLHRNPAPDRVTAPNVVNVIGDLMQPNTINELLIPGCTIVNLAYLATRSKQENLAAMSNLVDCCKKKQVRRLIHCSTAAVMGNIPDTEVNEETKCSPKNEYERSKYGVEKLVVENAMNRFDLAILRPTAVFGPDGKNLIKLAEEICKGNKTINYIKSCLYGYRKMNLVSIETVVAALIFLATKTSACNNEIFFISDDENPNNNYRYVEQYLTATFGFSHFRLPRFPVPQFFLSSCLRMAGKTNTNPQRIYLSSKIEAEGFVKTVSFEKSLESFADWYKYKFESSSLMR